MKTTFGISVLMLLSAAPQAFGRFNVAERDDMAITLTGRRFGQEMGPAITEIANACETLCAILAGQAVSTLLAGSPECEQQDMADRIIDYSSEFDRDSAARMVAAAISLRKSEKNTPPDTTVTPTAFRNSVYCQKRPRSKQLVGLVQAQDPANDPNLFYDPATRATVRRGAQPNTRPYKG